MRHGTAYWTAHLAAIKREGISTSAYARRHRIAAHSLYYWQHKLSAVPDAARRPPAHQASADTNKLPNAFVALRVAEPVAAAAQDRCTLLLGSGLRLELSALPTPTWLAALDRTLRGAH
ncbi:MAG: IS66 family insertion sequence element accessory protein TnpA [Burkholderiales bacterium]